MSQLERLRPNNNRRVIDLVQEAGIDVSDWANYANGMKSPAANPKYCYEWSFIEPGQVVVLNLWHYGMREQAGVITLRDNLRRQAERYAEARTRQPWRRRAEKLDQAVSYAYVNQLPIRVIILDGRAREHEDLESEASRVEARALDAVPWAVTAYDTSTGDFTVTRGALPGRVVDQFELSDGPELPPAVRTVSGKVIVRNPLVVRQRVLDRAAGRCEWCGDFGFATHAGAIFLETHHVVQLSEGGPDTSANVVALCPNHHREAHFGASREGMRESLRRKLATLSTTKKNR